MIIPHAGGAAILNECLKSLISSEDVEYEVIIVDNGSNEEPARWGVNELKTVQVLRYQGRIGFAAACNRGVESARGEYILLLNNDAVVAPDTLKILKGVITQADDIAAVTPKILNYFNPTQFDYSSAAGGMLDRYGFPFARGRIFEHIELDRGQYDNPQEVFWGAGAALMLKRDLWLKAGGLEESFFAHMEEIDLLWRLHLMGYRVVAVPSAVVRHRGAVTIRSGSFLKAYLNHRNSLAMMVRNYCFKNVIKFLPVRLAMDLAYMVLSLIRFNFRYAWAIFRALLWLFFSINSLILARKKIQGLRKVSDDIILNILYKR